MPLAYSLDRRWRVIWMHLAHQTATTRIAELLGISERTVRRYLNSFKNTGDVLPEPHRNGPQRLLGEHEQLIILRLRIQ